MTALFALDQGFPLPIVRVLEEFIEEAELVHLQQIDPRLAEDLDDWQLLLALHHHERPWDGLITTDSSMLSLARELAVMLQTKLTVVAAEGAGHDPIKATGLVLTHLPVSADASAPTSRRCGVCVQRRGSTMNRGSCCGAQPSGETPRCRRSTTSTA